MSDNTPTTTQKPKCGIIMPISAIDGLSESHWSEVGAILSDAIVTAGFEPNLVSIAEEVGIIQKTIIQNLYDNPVVVCDVSAKNPNVMFELGIRLAFDKPTIIVKDDKTSYTFDTSPIEHLNYPRDLRFSQIVDFKARVAEKVKSTHYKASNDPNYTTFLKNFGEFKVAKIDQTEISGQQFIIEELKSVRQAIVRLENLNRKTVKDNRRIEVLQFGIPSFSPETRHRMVSILVSQYPDIKVDIDGDILFVKPAADWSLSKYAEFENFVRNTMVDAVNGFWESAARPVSAGSGT